MHADLQLGFTHSSYHVVEGVESYFTFEIEVKNNGTFAIPIDFTVTDTEGESRSEFFFSLGM